MAGRRRRGARLITVGWAVAMLLGGAGIAHADDVTPTPDAGGGDAFGSPGDVVEGSDAGGVRDAAPDAPREDVTRVEVEDEVTEVGIDVPIPSRDGVDPPDPTDRDAIDLDAIDRDAIDRDAILADTAADADPDAGEGPVRIERLVPGELVAGVETEIVLFGAGFEPTFSYVLGPWVLDAFAVEPDGTRLTSVLPEDALEPGLWDIRVFDEDGALVAERVGAFFVVEGDAVPPFRIDYVDPPVVRRGQTVDLRITGSGFTSGAQVVVGSIELPNRQVSEDGTFIQALLTGDLLAVTGPVDLRVTLPDGETTTLTAGLLVRGPEEPEGCSVATSPPGALAGLALLGLLRRRRRR